MLYPNREQSNKLGPYKHQINQDIGCFQNFPSKTSQTKFEYAKSFVILKRNANGKKKNSSHSRLGI